MTTTIYGGNTDHDEYIYTVLITGDRDWDDDDLVYGHLLEICEWCEHQGYEMHVISGRATGADEAADKASLGLQIPFHGYPAPWRRIGRSAGPRRNKVMAERHEIDEALAFHDNIKESTGTADMIKIMKKMKIPHKLITH